MLDNHLILIQLDDEIFTFIITEKHLIESTIWAALVVEEGLTLVMEMSFILVGHCNFL